MARLSKGDLAQMGEDYFESLEPERLVEVTKNLYELAVEQLEKLEESSRTSSRPPSSDNPYRSSSSVESAEGSEAASVEPTVQAEGELGELSERSKSGSEEKEGIVKAKGFGRRPAGKQRGAKGKWRQQPLKAERVLEHHPESCAACNVLLEGDGVSEAKAYMGYYQFELVSHPQELKVECQLHRYYGATCRCGHQSQAAPGQGERFEVAGRKRQLWLQDYGLVGPMLGSFLASLSVRYRLSRAKIQEFLQDWVGLELSIGTLDRSIREAGLACGPVVEALLEELQQAEIVHLDETPWYESGRLCWLWVAINSSIAVFVIGRRTKEALLQLISEAFVGWLVSDGYGAYRWYENRQRCLAHLIRKALAVTQALDAKASEIAQWLLEEMRALIHAIATLGRDDPDDPGHQRLKKLALLATASQHPKLKALAKEILNDWEAVVAFVFNPNLPPTNNLAERALRHAVISRRISLGTRSAEGSRAYAALLSIIETCRLRTLNPWTYLAQVIALRRKGLQAPQIPKNIPLQATA